MDLPSDLTDLLAEFDAGGVEYLVVGGLALALHGHPRFTKDVDLWLRDSEDNIQRAVAALVAFGAPSITCEGVFSIGPRHWLLAREHGEERVVTARDVQERAPIAERAVHVG
jgi:hypothetical protein